MKSSNNFDAPPATKSEKLVREILRANNIYFKTGQVLWLTDYEKYTPDLIIGRKGKKLIVEVDGKIHEDKHQINKDRIRQRALKNMGYAVFRVKNEEVQKRPDVVAAKIMGEYSQLTASDSKKEIKITELEKPVNYKPIPSKINYNLKYWVREFNTKLNYDMWSTDFFKEELSRYHPEIVKNKSIMESVILQLWGLNLHKMDDGNIDFEYSLIYLSIQLLNELFDGDNMIETHLKNQINRTAPGFFKNLIFQGGPHGNEGLVSIKDKNSLNFHIDTFNKYLSELGINVTHSDIKQDCKAAIQNVTEDEKKITNGLLNG